LSRRPRGRPRPRPPPAPPPPRPDGAARAPTLHPHPLQPTNHLDVTNVAWLTSRLTAPDAPTCLIVSHDSAFLDAVCTHVLHYAHKQLAPYRGNLSAFVKRVPAAASYYSLANAPQPFKFPQPGILVGVSSRDRAILKLRGVSFTYPGAPKPQLTDVDVSVTLSSRVAVRGANGAGKSTLIKMMTGETAPDDGGTYWKHPNLRVAYVAQHAFHHVEKHLEETPLAYIQWRWGGGEDREALEKATRAATAEDLAAMAKPIAVDGVYRVVEALVGRRKHKNSFEYEVAWKGERAKHNAWIARDALIALGFTKMVDDLDAEAATREGLLAAGAKEFTAPSIVAHLADFGLDAEFACHSAIKGLSGGQKVKVVLAAACWNCPHIVVLDEVGRETRQKEGAARASRPHLTPPHPPAFSPPTSWTATPWPPSSPAWTRTAAGWL